MDKLLIDAKILSDFKSGVKEAAKEYKRQSTDVYYMGAYKVDEIDVCLDSLIDRFANAVINECMSNLRNDIPLRIQVLDIASKYKLSMDYVEGYIFEGKK